MTRIFPRSASCDCCASATAVIAPVIPAAALMVMVMLPGLYAGGVGPKAFGPEAFGPGLGAGTVMYAVVTQSIFAVSADRPDAGRES